MNSPCIDFVMFSRGQHHDVDDNMSRRTWKRDLNEDEELANCLVMLSNSGDAYKHGHDKGKTVKKQKTAHVFQCKACKKVFASHQALGGHRASHKKVKGCFASQDKEEAEEEEYKEDDDEDEEDDDDDDEEEEEEDKSTVHISRKRSKAHECTICHRVFSSGQALGGHKRCHWLTPSNYMNMTPLHDHPAAGGRSHHQPSLDLNLACQEYSVDPTVMSVGLVGRDGGGRNNHNSAASSWLKLASGDWS